MSNKIEQLDLPIYRGKIKNIVEAIVEACEWILKEINEKQLQH